MWLKPIAVLAATALNVANAQDGNQTAPVTYQRSPICKELLLTAYSSLRQRIPMPHPQIQLPKLALSLLKHQVHSIPVPGCSLAAETGRMPLRRPEHL